MTSPMLTKTTTAMLQDLLEPGNEAAWRAFDERFRPILVAFGRRLGLTGEDAADAAQETLSRFVRAYRAGKYDRDRGRLRSWIVGIARNCIRDLQAQQVSRREARGMSAVAGLPDDDQLTQMWDDECSQRILRLGLVRLREETKTGGRTIDAFEMLAFRQRTPAAVAEAIGMSLNDVYLAKHRCLRRLRAIIEELEAAFEHRPQ